MAFKNFQHDKVTAMQHLKSRLDVKRDGGIPTKILPDLPGPSSKKPPPLNKTSDFGYETFLMVS